MTYSMVCMGRYLHMTTTVVARIHAYSKLVILQPPDCLMARQWVLYNFEITPRFSTSEFPLNGREGQPEPYGEDGQQDCHYDK